MKHPEIPAPNTAEASFTPQSPPFVWQCGRRLLLLEREQEYWVLAELEFGPEICRYTELRRCFYEWEREAAGALLSRTLACGEVATAASAEQLARWMSSRR
ncbi:MAG: hypothetical protein KC438_08110 [Thermomicrobiales bacterium]|nr:hypothetical protein [Thermomicrobiales bacterium]MCO5221903.1 hypothetical protein [Thermomicrobiales bacterium]